MPHSALKAMPVSRMQFARDRRVSSCKRGYDRRWQRMRTLVLAEQPFCRWPGCDRPSEQVDHIIALSRGGTNEMDNLFCTLDEEDDWSDPRLQRCDRVDDTPKNLGIPREVATAMSLKSTSECSCGC